MDKETRKKIFEDYKRAQGEIEEVLKSGKNCFVKNINDYLTPTIVWSAECGFEDERGQLKYFSTIRNTLEEVLSGESGKMICYFNSAPDYIKDKLS